MWLMDLAGAVDNSGRGPCWRRHPDGSLVAMAPSHRSPSPDVAALRVATEGIVRQLGGQTREQARLIRSGAAGELTEADVERIAASIAAAARAQLEASVQDWHSPSDDPDLQATRREAA